MAPVKRNDSRAGRTYTIDGVGTVPSVTTILSVISKPALVNWAAKTERTLVMDAAADLYLDLLQCKPMGRPTYLSTLDGRVGATKAHQRELAKAAEIGTQAHALVEWNLRRQLGQVVGPEPRITDEAQWAFMAWQDWAASVQLEPVFVEQTVWSTVHRYAGTLDLLARVNGKLTVLDWKTGKAIYAEAKLQNVAYRQAVAEMGHGEPEQGLIVRLPKVTSDPAFEVAEVPPVADLWSVFLAVRALYDWWAAEDQKGLAAWQAKRDGGGA